MSKKKLKTKKKAEVIRKADKSKEAEELKETEESNETEASEEKEPQSDPVVSYLIKSFQNLSETIQFIMIPVGYTRYDMQFA